MSVNLSEIGELAARIKKEIDVLGAREPEHPGLVAGLTFSLLGNAICGDKAMPFIYAAINACRPPGAGAHPAPLLGPPPEKRSAKG